ncbi:MAG: MTAP family purine nucleoside phosphorylase [Methanoregulaceae archaeon]|nr:MTAP family purine nucleoside phosphorylase [Methanoregulaceae archaeon]
MLGIIGGTSLLYSDLPPLGRKVLSTPFGRAEVLEGEIVLLLRHQGGIPPHRINHCANLAALAMLGVGRIISIGSAGSLKGEITPGSMVIPTDYVSSVEIPSIHDHSIVHVRPEISHGLATRLALAVPEATLGGTYVQTRGPRIETVAEVKALALIADLVGMTVASEATLARELGMEFAALCTVDNYANGLGKEVLTYEHILETSKEHACRTSRVMEQIIRELG